VLETALVAKEAAQPDPTGNLPLDPLLQTPLARCVSPPLLSRGNVSEMTPIRKSWLTGENLVLLVILRCSKRFRINVEFLRPTSLVAVEDAMHQCIDCTGC